MVADRFFNGVPYADKGTYRTRQEAMRALSHYKGLGWTTKVVRRQSPAGIRWDAYATSTLIQNEFARSLPPRRLKDIPKTKTFDGRQYKAHQEAVFGSREVALKVAQNFRDGGWLARAIGYPEAEYRSWFETGVPDKHRSSRKFWVVYYAQRV